MTPALRLAPVLGLAVALATPALAQTTPAPVNDAAPAADASAPTAPAAAPVADPAPPAASAAPAATPGPAAAPENISGSYSFDPEHSHIVFSYDHMAMSTSHGMITGVTGTIVLDEADPTRSTVEASFPLSAIHTIAPALDRHLFSDDLFKGAAPETQVTFKSTSVKKGDDADEAMVTGDLTMNGVTKPVTLEVEMTEAGAHPMTGKPAVGFDIEGKIKRSDFGLGAFAPAVSDEVELEISVEASKG